MIEICEKKSCTGCGACSHSCPKNCIDLKENNEGFLYPVIDSDICVECGKCKKVCPINNLPEKNLSKFYMGWNRDDKTTMKSSSGGVFSALAKTIFDMNGVVFGASQKYNPNYVYHTVVKSYDELDKIRLSKYNQSDLKDTFVEVKDFLVNNTPVLFCGTACQIGGLLKYLSFTKAKNNLSLLYTVDVLCHGVASQKTVNAFIKSKEKKYKKKIKKYYFRTKTNKGGWKSGCGTMKLIFNDGSSKVAPLGTDTFFLGFNNNLFLRESCYNCKYCGQKRVADFTIADYWGVPENSVSDKQLFRGVSVLTVNTSKASDLLSELEKYMVFSEISPEIAVANNRSFSKPNPRPQNRDYFFETLDKMDYDSAIKKLLGKTYIKSRIKYYIGQDRIKKIKSIFKKH